MKLETERLILRPFTTDDTEDLFEYAQDPRVGPPAGWPPHKDLAECRSILISVFIETEDEPFAMQLKESNKVIGSVGLQKMSWDKAPKGAWEIGYCLNPAYWGQGLMPEAVQELLRYGFEDHRLSEIWCGHYDFNSKSRRVIEKVGFRYVTTDIVNCRLMNEDRTELFYKITREEWKAWSHT